MISACHHHLPPGNRASLLQGSTFPELCPQGSCRADSAPAPLRYGKSEPISGTSCGDPGNRYLSQVVVQGQEVRLELTAALYHTGGRAHLQGAPTQDQEHPEAGKGCVQTAAVSPDPAAPEASPALHVSVKAANHFPLCRARF